MSGWYETYDGRSVYSEDGEMWWYADLEQWFHLPNLQVRPYRPGIEGTLGREADRLSSGWPSLWSAFKPFETDEHGDRRPSIRMGWGWNAIGWIARAYFLAFVVVLAVCGYDFVRVWLDQLGAVQYDALVVPQGVVTTESKESALKAWYIVHLAILFGTVPLWGLYYGRLSTVDPQKGHVLAVGTVAATAYRQHQRQERAREERLAHDIADHIERRHHGQYRW